MPHRPDVPVSIAALLASPSGWLPCPEGFAPIAGLDVWERDDGTWYTLAPWAAEALGVHPVEQTGREREAAAALGVPVGDDEPGFRWADLDDEGPVPRQPRERPCVVRPVCLWGAGVDYRLEQELRRRGVPLLPREVAAHELFGIATRDGRGRGLGGLGAAG